MGRLRLQMQTLAQRIAHQRPQCTPRILDRELLA
jgi:hypothetical protein